MMAHEPFSVLIRQTAEYRRFHKLLKQVIKAPPLVKRALG
jgi:hypothetical protein